MNKNFPFLILFSGGDFFMGNDELEQARIKWQQAINVFNNAVTKEDIDYAVYNLEAKKKQYVRLLKIYKNEAQLKDDFE